MKDIRIIKDPEEEIYYVCHNDEFDSENEFTIISYGETKVEALEKAINAISKPFHACQSQLRCISENLRGDKLINNEFIIDYCDIQKPCDFGNGNTAKSFDALFWNEESQQWGRFYR